MYVVLPTNWHTVRLACAVMTQWRYGPSGHPLGLDYAACKVAAEGLGMEWAGVFDGLRIMEAALLDTLPSR